jgi:hypothetical protein
MEFYQGTLTKKRNPDVIAILWRLPRMTAFFPGDQIQTGRYSLIWAIFGEYLGVFVIFFATFPKKQTGNSDV